MATRNNVMKNTKNKRKTSTWKKACWESSFHKGKWKTKKTKQKLETRARKKINKTLNMNELKLKKIPIFWNPNNVGFFFPNRDTLYMDKKMGIKKKKNYFILNIIANFFLIHLFRLVFQFSFINFCSFKKSKLIK
jgi:hypothetical protein